MIKKSKETIIYTLWDTQSLKIQKSGTGTLPMKYARLLKDVWMFR